jgi:hypothetical protein
MPNEQTELAALEAQIRECFGRVIYTHKTHSKMADRAANKLRMLKIWQIALSSLAASGTVGILFSNELSLKLATALVSFATVGINAYMKGFDPGAVAQKHRDTAADIWPIRESYLSLLTDIVGGEANLEQLRVRRDDLQNRLAAIYKGAPDTDSDAYDDAQRALKQNEEYTFSDSEIDKFLPTNLRKGSRS